MLLLPLLTMLIYGSHVDDDGRSCVDNVDVMGGGAVSTSPPTRGRDGFEVPIGFSRLGLGRPRGQGTVKEDWAYTALLATNRPAGEGCKIPPGNHRGRGVAFYA